MDMTQSKPTAQFRIGDLVRSGPHVATVTDVGTVLIALRTTVGAARMACAWELVPLKAAHDELGVDTPR